MQSLKYAAAYIRVSDHRQEEYSPASQLRLLREYASKNGYILPDKYIFQDDGISAKTVTKRPQFNNMIAFAKDKSHPFEVILVWKFSRFARNQEESIIYKSLLRKNGVEVISISEPVMEGPFGDLIERIIEFFDEFYLIRLSGEVKRGMTEKVTRGEPICAPAFGYDIRDKQYYPSADAPIVRDVFESYRGGEPIRHIAQRLAGVGVRTRRGNPPDKRWIEYMLRNPVYIGKIRWCTDGRGASRRDYDNPQNLITNGIHEPIIETELWEAVQSMIAETKQRYGKYQRREQAAEFMLKGMLRCSNCGATLVRCAQPKNVPEDQYRLQCHNYTRGSCSVSHSISGEEATQCLVAALEECIRTRSFNIIVKNDSAQNIVYEKLIADDEEKLARVRYAYENGIDTAEEYKSAKLAIQNELESLRRRRAEAGGEPQVDMEAFCSRVQAVLEYILDATNSEQSKNEMLRSVVDALTYEKETHTISIRFYL